MSYKDLVKHELIKSITLLKYEQWSIRDVETGNVTEYDVLIVFNNPYIIRFKTYEFTK